MPSMLGYSFLLVCLIRHIRLYGGILLSDALMESRIYSTVTGILAIIAGLTLLLVQQIDGFFLNSNAYLSSIEVSSMHDYSSYIPSFVRKAGGLLAIAVGIFIVLRPTCFVNLVKRITGYQLMVFLLLVSLSIQFFNLSFQVSRFARDGQYLNSLLRLIQEKNDSKSIILVIADPYYNYEDAYSIRAYLKLVANINNLYVMPIRISQDYGPFGNNLIKSFDTLYGEKRIENIVDKKSIDTIAVLEVPRQELDIKFRADYQDSLNPDKFLRTAFGNYVVYSKK